MAETKGWDRPPNGKGNRKGIGQKRTKERENRRNVAQGSDPDQ